MVTRREIEQSDTLDAGVRVGLMAYGVVHLLVAYTAARLAFGEGGGTANQKGALSELAQEPGGNIGLWVVALGLFALVLWQGFEAVVGHTSEDGGKKAFKRVASAIKAVIYLSLGVSAIQKAVGTSTNSSGTDSLSAQLMSAPGGRFLVAGIGLALVGAGGYLAWKGWTEKFTKRLDSGAQQADRRAPIVLLGKVGYIAKGIALAVVGGLFVNAAVQFEPKKSGGLDQALHTVLAQPFGRGLLLAVALGLGCFGAYCFAWARHLRR